MESFPRSSLFLSLHFFLSTHQNETGEYSEILNLFHLLLFMMSGHFNKIVVGFVFSIVLMLHIHTWVNTKMYSPVCCCRYHLRFLITTFSLVMSLLSPPHFPLPFPFIYPLSFTTFPSFPLPPPISLPPILFSITPTDPSVLF